MHSTTHIGRALRGIAILGLLISISGLLGACSQQKNEEESGGAAPENGSQALPGSGDSADVPIADSKGSDAPTSASGARPEGNGADATSPDKETAAPLGSAPKPNTVVESGAAAAGLTAGIPAGAAAAAKAFPMVEGEWHMWGGQPGRNMVNPFPQSIPHEWDVESGKNIKFVAELGSQSYGNPIISRGKILVGTNNDRVRNPSIKGDKGVIMCFSEADGAFIWQLVHDKLSAGRVNDWPEQGICSTPVIQGKYFYYVSNQCQVVCADMEGLKDGNDGPYKDEKYTSPIDGDIIWIYDMMDEMGVFPHNLATCSPLLIGDIVYVVTSNGVERDHITIPSPRAPSFLALNKKSGEYVWDSVAPGENILHGQWSAPAYGKAGGREQVVFPGGDGWMYSFEPLTGKEIWKFNCNPEDSKWELGGLGTKNNIISTPVFYGDSVYVAVGQDPEHGEGIGNLFRIRADGTGDVTKTHKVWSYGGEHFRRTISTVAILDGLIYASDLSGFLYCLDQKTGKRYWTKDLLAAVWGSPTVIDGKVFIGDEDGDLFVCKVGTDLVELAENTMDDSVYSTPVAAKGVLYIVNRTRLVAIQKK